MSEQPFERLAYQNRFVKELIQPLVGVDCFQERADLNVDDNLIALRLSEAQFIQIYSSLLTGADICYPDESLQIVANFLKALHCPPELVPHECLEYPPFSPFIAYPLQNPYNNPDFIPAGYLVPPFALVTAENIGEYPQNEVGDIVVPFAAISFDANWFEDISETLPTITINFQGTGQANIRLLNQAQGGLAIITLDNPPSLVDIIAGIISGGDNIIDTNLDILSLPPETAIEHIFPVEIETTGLHTVYVVFFPIVDDSLIPLRFGGGFRGVELCGELEVINVGMEDIRYSEDTSKIQARMAGEWLDKIDVWAMVAHAVNPMTDTSFYNDGMNTIVLQQRNAAAPVFNDVAWIDLSHLENPPPFDPSALEDAISAVDEKATQALESAATANEDNVTQDATLGDHETRIVALESAVDSLDSRLTVLEGQQMWSQHWDFTTSQHGFGHDGGSEWNAGTGFEGFSFLSILKGDTSFNDGRIAYYRLELTKVGAGEGQYFSGIAGMTPHSYGICESGANIRYHKVPNVSTRQDMEIEINGAGVTWQLTGLTIYGYGTSDLFDD